MRARLVLVFVLVALSPALAAAESPTNNKDPVLTAYVGGFFPKVESTVTVNGESTNPPPIDSENLLGLESGSNVLWGGVRWRFARRQRIEIEYFSLNRTGANGFEGEEIEIGDFLLESGAINTTSKASIGRLT